MTISRSAEWVVNSDNRIDIRVCDLPEPVMPIIRPCGPMPPSASSLRSKYSGSPVAVTPIGTRSSSSRRRGAHSVGTSSAEASAMSSRVLKVAPLVAAERSPAWVGLESQRASARARWAASATTSVSAASISGSQPEDCQRSIRPSVTRRIGRCGSGYWSRPGSMSPAMLITVTPASPSDSTEADSS